MPDLRGGAAPTVGHRSGHTCRAVGPVDGSTRRGAGAEGVAAPDPAQIDWPAAPIDTWRLTFGWPATGQAVTNGWRAAWTQAGRRPGPGSYRTTTTAPAFARATPRR